MDPRASARQDRDAREHGLVHMPPVDQCMASLVLSPDEALREDAQSPRPQCQVMLLKAYATATRMARIGNTLSVPLLAQAQMLQPEHEGRELGETNEVALEAFGLMSGELGCLMSTLVVTQCQVWLARGLCLMIDGRRYGNVLFPYCGR